MFLPLATKPQGRTFIQERLEDLHDFNLKGKLNIMMLAVLQKSSLSCIIVDLPETLVILSSLTIP